MAPLTRFSPDEIINMNLRREAGESVRSIAEDYDCSERTVRYHTHPDTKVRELDRKRNMTPRVLAAKPGGRPFKFTDAQARDMARLWREGVDLDTIAARYGTVRNTVRRYITRLQEPPCPPSL